MQKNLIFVLISYLFLTFSGPGCPGGSKGAWMVERECWDPVCEAVSSQGPGIADNFFYKGMDSDL